MFSFNNLGRYGRLGNQMFQYAALLALSHRKGTFCTAPLSGSQIYHCFDLKECNNGFLDQLGAVYREPEFGYQDNINTSMSEGVRTDLVGYFQSEKYFSDCADLIRKEYTFRPEIVESAEKKGFDPQNKVAIHIRRTDYVGLKDTHPPLEKVYYRAAMEHFLSEDFLIFSDDVEWCRKSDMFFGEEKNGFYFSNGDTYEDLYLMSQCKGHIIANSSFSWWGAWLANRGKVVSPKTWFGPKGPKDWQDVYCDGWITL